jgi:hypothetical protein
VPELLHYAHISLLIIIYLLFRIPIFLLLPAGPCEHYEQCLLTPTAGDYYGSPWVEDSRLMRVPVILTEEALTEQKHKILYFIHIPSVGCSDSYNINLSER